MTNSKVVILVVSSSKSSFSWQPLFVQGWLNWQTLSWEDILFGTASFYPIFYSFSNYNSLNQFNIGDGTRTTGVRIDCSTHWATDPGHCIQTFGTAYWSWNLFYNAVSVSKAVQVILVLKVFCPALGIVYLMSTADISHMWLVWRAKSLLATAPTHILAMYC